MLDIQQLIEQECDALKALLLEKNRKYGNAALDPMRIFSRTNPIEQINVRIDDKLSRIANRQNDEDEDPEKDLAGYLILKRCAEKLQAHYEQQQQKKSTGLAPEPTFSERIPDHLKRVGETRVTSSKL